MRTGSAASGNAGFLAEVGLAYRAWRIWQFLSLEVASRCGNCKFKAVGRMSRKVVDATIAWMRLPHRTRLIADVSQARQP